MKRINKNKRLYSKPQLDVIEVDHEISFIMMTEPIGDAGPLDPFGASLVSPTSQSSPASVAASSLESDPFGGSSPSY